MKTITIMSFQELANKFSLDLSDKKNWHQHKNGGGWVHNTAKVDDTVFIGEAAVIFSGNAQVSGDAQVFGNAQVSGNAWVYGDAQVYGNAWEGSPLFILGSRHSLTNAKHGHIQIGCHCKPIKWWLENFEDIGKKEAYTDSEIEEYGEYIKLFKKLGK